MRLMASTRPSGQPSRKQSDTSKSKRPGFNTRLVLLPPRTSTLSFIKLGDRHGQNIQNGLNHVITGLYQAFKCMIETPTMLQASLLKAVFTKNNENK